MGGNRKKAGGEIEIWKFQRELREKKATVGSRRKNKKGGVEIEKKGGNRDLEISTRTKREESNSWKKKKIKRGGAEIEKKGARKSRFRNFPRELREKEATIGRRKKQ